MAGPFVRLILGNLLRRWLRSAVTAIGVAVACAALYSLISFQRGYQSGLRGELDRLGAHLLVVPKGCPYDAASFALHGASWPCYLKEDYLQEVRSAPHVTTVAPVYMAAVYRPDNGQQIVYCGVTPDIVQLKRTWRIRGRAAEHPDDLLVGSGIAAMNGWDLDRQIEMPGLKDEQGRVAGILDPTQGADDFFIFMPIATAQRIFKRPGQLTHMLVKLDDPANMSGTVAALRGCGAGLEMNVVPLAHLFKTIQNLVDSTRLFLLSAALVGLLVAAAGVSNSILMAVVERTREIGVLRAIGASRSHVFGLIWIETIALCICGGCLGILLAVAGSKTVEAWLRTRLPFAPTGDLMRPESFVAALCILGAIGVGTIAGLLPALRAARLSPVAAIRSHGGLA